MDSSVKRRSDITIILLIFIGLTAIGVAGAGFIVRDYAMARASTGWPIYDGIVLSRRDGEDGMRYVYSVDGRSYESSRQRFFTGKFSVREGKALGSGETVSVFVDPQDHTTAVLQPGGVGGVFAIGSIVFGMCVFFGVGGIVRTLTLVTPESYATNEELNY